MEIKTVLKRLSLMLVAAMFAVGLSACDTNDSAAEQAGEKIDNAATDAGNAIEDACEDAKEGANADDTDC